MKRKRNLSSGINKRKAQDDLPSEAPKKLKVTELRKALDERGLNSAGLKADLEQRLADAIAADTARVADPSVDASADAGGSSDQRDQSVLAVLKELNLPTLESDENTVRVMALHDFSSAASLQGLSKQELVECGLTLGMANLLAQAVKKNSRPHISIISSASSQASANNGKGQGGNPTPTTPFRPSTGSRLGTRSVSPCRSSFGAVDSFEWSVDEAQQKESLLFLQGSCSYLSMFLREDGCPYADEDTHNDTKKRSLDGKIVTRRGYLKSIENAQNFWGCRIHETELSLLSKNVHW